MFLFYGLLYEITLKNVLSLERLSYPLGVTLQVLGVTLTVLGRTLLVLLVRTRQMRQNA